MRRALLALLLLPLLATSAARATEAAFTLRDASGAPVADAVVSLAPLDAPPPAPAPAAKPAVIAQIGEQYQPYVTAIRVGTLVEFPNKDKVQHHIYSVSRAKPFEKPLYESGASESVLFDNPGIVTLGCNIHDWMAAYVVVLETPHFAKTGDDGLAALAALPPGRYTLQVWHPRLPAPLTREVAITATSPLAETIDLRLRPDRRVRRAPVAEGKAY
jgi:plastocyanin